MAPFIAQLAAWGLPLIAEAVKQKGKEVVEEKLGITLKPDMSAEEIQVARSKEIEHKEFLINAAQKEFETVVSDRISARELYKHHHELQASLAKHIMQFNLIYVFILVLIDVLLIKFTPPELAAAVNGLATIIGMVINSLLKERQDVVGFSFGSSTGSKLREASK